MHLFTDSLYLRKGVTDWLPGWVARGWRRKDGELQTSDIAPPAPDGATGWHERFVQVF